MPAKVNSGGDTPDNALFQMSKAALERIAETRFRTELSALSSENMTQLLQTRDLTASQQKIVKFYIIDARNQSAADVLERAENRSAKRKKNTPRKARTKATTSAASDLHLAIRPDGDTALFGGLLAEIDRRGAVDQDYVSTHVAGFDQTLTAAQAMNPADTGLHPDDIRRFHDLWIGTEKVVTVFSQGVNQSVGGTDKVNAIINCHLATGRIGRVGMGPFSVTGQPNAMGGREVGGLANMLACHLDIENPAHRKTVRDAWQSPTICTHPGLKAVDLFQACADGKIKALWIIGTNPAVSMPNADAVTRAIQNVDFTVISEVVNTTDTSVLTDVQLPATAWGEKTGTVTNSERRISLQRAFLPVPGLARPDWKILCDVARRMGWADAFDFDSPAAVFREYAALSGQAAALGRDFDISGLADITDADYADFSPVRWPVPTRYNPADRFFGNGKFFHEDGKARMVPVTAIARSAPAPKTYVLNTGRIRDQWHTMTRSGKSPRLNQHLAEPFAEIHPKDARDLRLATAELLEIQPPQGRVVVRARITDDTPRGSLFVPMHWSNTNAPTGRINACVPNVTDPMSGQPASKSTRVRAQRFSPDWYGFAASAAQMKPALSYSAVARTTTGWRCELADQSTPDNWEHQARQILNLDDGSVSMMRDPSRGTVRVAIHQGAVLKGLFFASPRPVSVARDLVISKINQDVPALAALAGLPMADQPDPGPIVCACFNVGANPIRAAIQQGATTMVAVGQCTAAGTNCGSCKPELQALINASQLRTAAE
ncbi:MAG: molybdopterin-dependent oxidoreductase [Rhodobacteraceae bacterium]|nr:molybdopterin-dependent oxidoreductase [Paracoccaceae bacterium]